MTPLKKLAEKILAFKANREDIHQKKYNGKPYIVVDKETPYSKEHVYSSHYCKPKYVDFILSYCKKHKLTVVNHGLREKDSKTWAFLSISHKGKYITGQCFHRLLLTVLTENGIEFAPKYPEKIRIKVG